MGNGQEYRPDDPVRMALVDFWTNTGGPNWIRGGNWNTQVPWCSWQGINCVDSQRDHHFELDQSAGGLIGTIPTSIKQLGVWVLKLTLNRNALTGTLPEEIGYLSSLQVLDVQSNQLSGDLPSSLAHLNLREFAIASNQFTGIGPEILRGVLTNCGSYSQCWMTGNKFPCPLPDWILNSGCEINCINLIHKPVFPGSRS